MAKRKRLDLSAEALSPALETKSAYPSKSRMPIATVAGDTAGQGALEEIAREMTTAETEGRVVKSLPIDKISMHHLTRDRMALDPIEMEALKASLSDRGQQSPIEVLRTGSGYGLISGMRRLVALRELEETHVLAFVRQLDTAAEAYQAMVEENEIRADLSFYERANIACAAVGQGVYRTPRDAVSGLFAHASAPKRSKILKFVKIRDALGNALQFPTAIPEKLGLALASALENDSALAKRVADALRKTPPADATAERKTLERALKKQGSVPAGLKGEEIAPGVQLQSDRRRVVLSGPAVDATFQEALRNWLVSHAKFK